MKSPLGERDSAWESAPWTVKEGGGITGGVPKEDDPTHHGGGEDSISQGTAEAGGANHRGMGEGHEKKRIRIQDRTQQEAPRMVDHPKEWMPPEFLEAPGGEGKGNGGRTLG